MRGVWDVLGEISGFIKRVSSLVYLPMDVKLSRNKHTGRESVEIQMCVRPFAKPNQLNRKQAGQFRTRRVRRLVCDGRVSVGANMANAMSNHTQRSNLPK